jgi:hypothetical protein
MSGQIDGIGDDGGGGIGLRRRPRQHRYRIGNAERKAAAVAAAGRDAPRGIVGVDHHRAHQAVAIGPIHQADGELLAVTEMQRDIAAIVDVSALELRRASIAPRISSATLPATAAIGVMKQSAANGATAACMRRATTPCQRALPDRPPCAIRQLLAELVEQPVKRRAAAS